MADMIGAMPAILRIIAARATLFPAGLYQVDRKRDHTE